MARSTTPRFSSGLEEADSAPVEAEASLPEVSLPANTILDPDDDGSAFARGLGGTYVVLNDGTKRRVLPQ